MDKFLIKKIQEQAAYIERLERQIESLFDGMQAARDMLDGAEAGVESLCRRQAPRLPDGELGQFLMTNDIGMAG